MKYLNRYVKIRKDYFQRLVLSVRKKQVIFYSMNNIQRVMLEKERKNLANIVEQSSSRNI